MTIEYYIAHPDSNTNHFYKLQDNDVLLFSADLVRWHPSTNQDIKTVRIAYSWVEDITEEDFNKYLMIRELNK